MMGNTLDPKKTGKNAEKTSSGKVVVTGLLVAILGAFGILVWVGMTGGSQHVPGSQPGVGFVKNDVGTPDEPPQAASAKAPGPVTKTVIDKKARDELRKRILAGWAASGEPEVAAAAKQGRFAPAPEGPDGGRMDPKYIQEVIRAELMPMAGKCYEELLSRKDAAAGRISMSFTIVADEKLGAIVEDAAADADGGVADERMSTCIRESLSTLSFRPPAHGGVVTVVYPIEFSPDEPDR
ncbi:MAG: AgmX/PglI C-terminal domain-containing protein [Deltaproteobacteria bacterium]|nr:AgmX/PglI C-terminal domain-containing protein [Deltaproteobacteria bacterium]